MKGPLLKDIRLNGKMLEALGACYSAVNAFDKQFKGGLKINTANWNYILRLIAQDKWEWDDMSWLMFGAARQTIVEKVWQIHDDWADRSIPWQVIRNGRDKDNLDLFKSYLNRPAIHFFTKARLRIIKSNGGF